MKSVKNTRKITKAMELVAASKMRRALAQASKSRTYARLAQETLSEVLACLPENVTHPLLAPVSQKGGTLLVVFSSDRGLAGGLNANLFRSAREYVRDMQASDLEVIAVGKKGGDALARLGKKVIARFPALSNNPAFADVLPVVHMAIQGFTSGKYKEVRVLFTNFISGVSQVPEIRTLLPCAMRRDVINDVSTTGTKEIAFEPSPAAVLDAVLPALTETLAWQMVLESTASEHAARMMAMKSASDAASDMLSSLTFTYNQARQGAITQEIAEISGGKAALESE